MRVILDECLDEGLRHHFTGHECQTCRYAGLTGLANGALLAAADQAGFDVLITVDQNMPNQQSCAVVPSRCWLFEPAPRTSMIC